MTYFGGSQSNERGRGSGRRIFCWCGKRVRSLQADAYQKGIRQQHKGDVAIPTLVAARFILIKSQRFGRLQILFNVPSASDGLHHERQGGVGWSPNQVVGQLVWVVEAAAKDEPLATIMGACIQHWQSGPIEKPQSLGALALAEALPILGVQCLVCDSGDVAEQNARSCLDTDDFDGGNCQGVSKALLFEPLSAAWARWRITLASSGLVATVMWLGMWAACLRGRSQHQSSGRYSSRSMRA